MATLQRFVNPIVRPLSLNITNLPGARLYFFVAGSTTPAATYADKDGEIPNSNPVVADSSGTFPPIFLDNRLYRVVLTDNKNVTQPGWPLDNVGQDSTIVPFGAWVEIATYSEDEIVTRPNGKWYRSTSNNNIGNIPEDSPSVWESIPIPVASSFTSNVPWMTFSDVGDQISVNVNEDDVGVVTNTRFTLGGTIGSSKVVFERIANTVNVTSVGYITHASSVTASSAVIPADYRIGAEYGLTEAITFTKLCVDGGGSYFAIISMSGDDTMAIQYRDLAGALISKTGPNSGISFSYNITTENP